MLIGYTFYQRCALNTSLRILVCDRLDNYVVAKGRPTPTPVCVLNECIVRRFIRLGVHHKAYTSQLCCTQVSLHPLAYNLQTEMPAEHVNYNNAHPKNQQQQQKPLMCLLFFCGKQSSTQAEKRYTDTHTHYMVYML